MQRLAIVGGLYQTIGFVTKIREVTAEFELQRVALGAIIKDGYEASKMFEQIKAAAVKSPFEIKDLVSYTKQLAAYKIETKDLFDTTMQLADISAGLGVGMERLVLAFGQIRATGYLRAAEVRQLTEAGIPIVEELAEKLSDMRGELISAGDVMQMISERAISFGMVKEVFDDMTSAGGTFYKMQEKQAETLAGQWSNLKDTLSIMYDEIGRSSIVQWLLQGFIDSTKTLASNWQGVRNILLSLTGVWGVFKVGSAFMYDFAEKVKRVKTTTEALIKSQKNLRAAQIYGNSINVYNAKSMVRYNTIMLKALKTNNAFLRSVKMIWAVIAANPISFLLTLLIGASAMLITIRQNATKLNKELAKIGSEGAMQADQQVRNFERLAKAINENTVGSKKHDDALQELKRTYGELLPARDEDILALVKEKSAHESVTQAIREKIAVQMKEQKINAITSEYGADIADAEKDLRAKFKKYSGMASDEVSVFIQELNKLIESGSIKPLDFFYDTKDFEEQQSKIKKIFDELGIKESSYRYFIDDVRNVFNDYIDTYLEYSNKVSEVTEEMENQTGLTGKLKDEWDKLQKRIADFKPTAAEYSFEYNEAKSEQALEEYKKFIIDNLGEGANLEFFISTGIETTALEDAIKDLPAQTKRAIRMAAEEYDKLVPSSDLQKLIKEKWQDIAKTTGASMTKLQNYYKKDEESTEDWVKGLQDALKERQSSIAELQKTQGLEGYEDNTERIKELTEEAHAFKLMIEYFKEFTKEYQKAQKKDSRLSDLKKQISDITNAYKKYIELRKYMSKEDALENIATFFPSLGNFEPTYENMVARLEKMRDEVRAKLAKSPADKILLDMSREIEKSLANIKFDNLKTELERKLERLSNDVAKTKTAKEFYDRILGITGDRELSATFTMSVYGETGDELAQRTIRQLETAFEGIDLSDAINYKNFQVDWKKVADIYKTHEGDMLEKNRKTADELIKNAQKISAEQIQQWAKELEEVKSYADKRVELAKQTAERIKEIEQSNIPQEQKDALTEQYRKREEEQASKLQYEAFKDSSAYVEMFNNLDNVSTTMLEHLKKKIAELQDEWQNLDPTQLKELQSRLNAIDKELAERNPFGGLIQSIKDYKELRESGTKAEAEEAFVNAIAKQKDEQLKLNDAIEARNQAQEKYDKSLKAGGSASTLTVFAKQQLDIAEKNLATQQKAMNEADEQVDTASKLLRLWNKIGASIEDNVVGALEKANSFASGLGSFLKDFSETIGAEAEEAEYINTIADGISGVTSGITNIAKGFASGDIGSVLSGIGGLVKNIKDLSQADSIYSANKALARQESIIKDLEYSWSRLEKAQGDALGSDYVELYERKIGNLKRQKIAYQKQADLESSKGKDADQAKIEEYENAARGAANSIKDMQGELSEYFLGTDLTSAARDFAQSWIEAYKQFGNTTNAMKEKFADMIQNMIIESLAASVMKKALEPVYNAVEQYSPGGISVEEATKIAKLTSHAADDANIGMTNLMNALKQAGLDVRDTAGGLTGISKDIATASEESILGLSAGINTQNFYISQIHANVALITQWVQSGGMATQSINVADLITIQNQHLSYLPNIATNTASTLAECKNILAETTRIANTLSSVVKPEGVKTAYRLNTSL